MSTVIQPRQFLPGVWAHTNFAAGQTTGVAMALAGWPSGFKAVVLPRQMSLVTVMVGLTAAVTSGFLRFELTKNGTDTGKTLDMDSSHGQIRVVKFVPGALVGDEGDRIGIKWGSHPSLAPSGIDGVVTFEVQPG
jgi:hypothetical protein